MKKSKNRHKNINLQEIKMYLKIMYGQYVGVKI